MRMQFGVLGLILLSLSFLSFLAAAPAAAQSFESVAGWSSAVASSCGDEAGSECSLAGVTRTALGGGIAHYTLDLKVGAGEREVVGLHRVVAESLPFLPKPTEDAVFLVHGDVWTFDAAFADVARFLAQAGVDVWGIDLRWTRVPAETTDFAFMADWGLSTDAHDVGVGLAVARGLRGATGSGFGTIHLLGWSRGGLIGYTYLNTETQKPESLRHAAGFIPVDIYGKTDDETLRQAACTRVSQGEARLAAGEYQDGSGALLAAIGNLAVAAPDADSPILPGLPNRTVALLAGAATFLFFPPGLEPVPFYHFTGGQFDANGLPTALSFTPESQWISFLRAGAPYEPVKVLLDSDRLICNQEDVPFDDHWQQVTVPILYVGAGGGFGSYGVYTTGLLGSTDVTSHLVSLAPPEFRIADFGHGDLFLATDAPALVWQPILEWIRAH